MTQDIARFERVRQRTQEVMQKAKTLFGVDVSSASIQFNLRGRTAGLAGCKYCAMTGKKTLSVRFNCEIIQGDQFDEFLQNTIPHEVAHLCGFIDPTLGRKHDGAWRRTCIALGGDGKTYHNYDVVVKGRWDYLTDLGNKVSVTKRYHAAVQAGLTLRFKKGLGSITKDSPHAPSGQLKVTQKPDSMTVVRTQPPAPKPVVKPKMATKVGKTVQVSSTGELTWAEKVRRLIRAHKPQGVSQDVVIHLAIQDLGMTKERAKSCVKAHWEKV